MRIHSEIFASQFQKAPEKYIETFKAGKENNTFLRTYCAIANKICRKGKTKFKYIGDNTIIQTTSKGEYQGRAILSEIKLFTKWNSLMFRVEFETEQ